MHTIEYTYVSLLADVASLSGFSEIRGSYEGLQWCLNEAPQLEKHILEIIENGGNPDLDLFPGWLKRLAAASVKDAYKLRLLRQLLLFCYKAQVTHDKTKTERAFSAFSKVNHETGVFGSSFSKENPLLLRRVRALCTSVLYKARWKEVIPSHGPGAVTTDKDRWQYLYSTIESLYPFSDWYSLYHNRDHLAEYDTLVHSDDISAKLIAVPKDSRGPRLICVHPAEAMWLQQGLRCELERVIMRPRNPPGPWPHGHIQFDDQSVNGRIALLSSRSRKYATLDLSEASDRLSDILVQDLFGSHYKFFGCCRAQSFYVKGHPLYGEPQALNAYAPMGNATVFPVQSLVFWAICVASMQLHGFHQPNAAFVFGDDIVVPSECAEHVKHALHSFGLLVNERKSFIKGGFRESCGVDAFNGVDVTPVRWKATLDAEHLVGMQSLSDLGMRLRISGYDEAAATVYNTLRKRLRRHGKDLFFTNNPDHGGLAEYTTSDYLSFRDAYWHRDIQWFTSPVWRVKARNPKGSGCGWNRVLESICALHRSGHSNVPARAVSRQLVLDRGWIPVK